MSAYKIVEKQSNMKDTFILKITGDSNDGDHVTETDYFDKGEFEYLLPELINLKNNYSGSHQLEKYPNKLGLPIPYNGYDGYCHSLVELTVEYIDVNGKIWDVEF